MHQLARIRLCHRHQRRLRLKIRHPEPRQARLRRTNQIARAAHLQINFRNPEAVIGIAHGHQPPLPALAQRGLIHQQTGRGPLAPPDTPAQLMQLRQAKTFRPLDHHDRGVGHIDADLNHRRRHQNRGLARLKRPHRRVFLLHRHLPMNQPDNPLSQGGPQPSEPHFGARQIHRLAFFHQGANPIGLMPALNGLAQMVHHLVNPRHVDQGRLDRLSPGRLFIQN